MLFLAIFTLIPLQTLAEQIDAWSRADCVMPCEVVSLEREGLNYTAELLSYNDGIIRPARISRAEYRSLVVGAVIPCAIVANRLILIKGYDTPLYQWVSQYKIEPLTVPVTVGVRVVERS